MRQAFAKNRGEALIVVGIVKKLLCSDTLPGVTTGRRVPLDAGRSMVMIRMISGYTLSLVFTPTDRQVALSRRKRHRQAAAAARPRLRASNAEPGRGRRRSGKRSAAALPDRRRDFATDRFAASQQITVDILGAPPRIGLLLRCTISPLENRKTETD